jgi:CheY-like chemotaxis protein
VRKALSWQPAAAVVDIGLPLLDGYEVASRLRQALDDRILLIALTGYGQPEDRSRAFAAGFDHHLTKPAEPADLLRLLRR